MAIKEISNKWKIPKTFVFIGFCCEKPIVAFRSAKVAGSGLDYAAIVYALRYFRGAKGDNPANLSFPQRKPSGAEISVRLSFLRTTVREFTKPLKNKGQTHL